MERAFFLGGGVWRPFGMLVICPESSPDERKTSQLYHIPADQSQQKGHTQQYHISQSQQHHIGQSQQHHKGQSPHHQIGQSRQHLLRQFNNIIWVKANNNI